MDKLKAWRGFVRESKSYMGYPKCGRLYFWLGFPRAFLRYSFYTLKDRWNRRPE